MDAIAKTILLDSSTARMVRRNATTAAIASSSTRESSSVESVGQPENGNVNKKEDIQKPTESKETTESSAAAEAERMVQ